MFNRLSRLLVAFALAVTSVIVATTPADAAPATGTTWIEHRNPHLDGSTIDVGAPNLSVVWYTVGVNSTWKGWSKLRSHPLTFSADTVSVQGDAVLSSWIESQWTGYNTNDPTCDIQSYDDTFTAPAGSCVNAVKFETVLIGWDTPTETLTSNLHSVRVRAGRTAVSDGKGRFDALRYDVYETGTSALSVDSSLASSVTAVVDGCVDESLVRSGDAPRVQLRALVNGVVAQSKPSAIAPWVSWSPRDHSRFVIEGRDTLQNIVASYQGTITLPNTGVVTVESSLDLRVGSQSVLETCPTSGDQYFPPVSAGPISKRLNASTEMHSFPAELNWVGDIYSMRSNRDGWGGLFLTTSDESGSRITRATSSGADDGFAGSGVVEWDHIPDTVTRYGDGGQQWLAFASEMPDDPSSAVGNVLTGTLSSEGTTSTSLANSDADPACLRPGASAWSIAPISAPTTLPLIEVSCQFDDGVYWWVNYSALAFIDTAHNNTVIPLASLTPEQAERTLPGSVSFAAVNPGATGSETAYWSYTENVSGDDYSTVVERLITTIAADGTVTQTPVDHDPFSGAYPWNVELIPGTSAGSWVGVGNFRNAAGYAYRQIVTVTADTSIAIASPPLLALAPISSSYAQVHPVAALSDSRFLALQSDPYQPFDGDNTSTFQAFILDTNAAAVSGRVVSTTVSNYASTPEQQWGWDTYGDPVLYNPISRTDYQVVTWVPGK